MSVIQIVSLSYNNIGSVKLNAHYLSEREHRLMEEYIRSLSPEGYFILSTCNRQEIYLDSHEDIRFKIIEKWMLLKNTPDISKSDFRSYYGNRPSLKYISTVAMGLLSAIKGDDQIYSQIKKAFNEARQQGNISTLLERMFQFLARINKRVINESNYRSKSVSLAYQSLKYARYLTQKIKNPSLLILGAGELSKQLVKNIPKFEFGDVAIANRTRKNAEMLQSIYPKADITSLDDIPAKMANYNIVISCLGHNRNYMEEFNGQADQGLHLFIDLTRTAKDVEIKNDFVQFVDLEDMFALLTKNESIRNKSIPLLYRLIQEEVDAFTLWVDEYKKRLEFV